MNLPSALLKQIIKHSDSDAWGKLRAHYLPEDYHDIYRAIERHKKSFLSLPTFDELKLGVRKEATLQKIHAIEAVEVDAEPSTLLEYLKNEFVQTEVFKELQKYIETTAIISDAQESLDRLQEIPHNIAHRVEFEDDEESMQSIDILYSEEEVASFVPLGFNSDFDATVRFARGDLVLVGGRRGHGKSLTCANIVQSQFASGNSSQYFSIEMRKKPTLQRIAAIGANVAAEKIANRTLGFDEYRRLAMWQASRFVDGEEVYEKFLDHKDYKRFHQEIVTHPLKSHKIDIIHENQLSLARIRNEVEVMKSEVGDQLSVVVVDYINKVKRFGDSQDIFDWKEQISVSKELKDIAEEYNVLMFVPYQIDGSGEARFSKGILDAADVSFTIDAHSKKDECMTFKCTKMRSSNDEASFTSVMDWQTLRIGPQSCLSPSERAEQSLDHEDTKGEDVSEL